MTEKLHTPEGKINYEKATPVEVETLSDEEIAELNKQNELADEIDQEAREAAITAAQADIESALKGDKPTTVLVDDMPVAVKERYHDAKGYEWVVYLNETGHEVHTMKFSNLEASAAQEIGPAAHEVSVEPGMPIQHLPERGESHANAEMEAERLLRELEGNIDVPRDDTKAVVQEHVQDPNEDLSEFTSKLGEHEKSIAEKEHGAKSRLDQLVENLTRLRSRLRSEGAPMRKQDIVVMIDDARREMGSIKQKEEEAERETELAASKIEKSMHSLGFTKDARSIVTHGLDKLKALPKEESARLLRSVARELGLLSDDVHNSRHPEDRDGFASRIDRVLYSIDGFQKLKKQPASQTFRQIGEGIRKELVKK